MAGQPIPITATSTQFSVNELTVRNLVGARRLPIRIALHPLYGHLISLMDGTGQPPAPPPPSPQAQPSSSSSFTVQRCVLDQCTFPALRMTIHLTQPSEMDSSSSSSVDHNHNNNSRRTAPNRHRCTALIFSTGRLIVTGTTEMETLRIAVNILSQLCNAFQSPNNV